MIKPRIALVEPGVWECACDLVSERGNTAKLAYDRWLNASLIDAVANLQPVDAVMENPISPEPQLAELTKSSSSIAESGHRKADPDKPHKQGRPISIKPIPKPLPVVKKQPKYHPSVVNVIPGTVATKEYRTPASLRINELRAEQSEPKLSPLVSKGLHEGRRFGL